MSLDYLRKILSWDEEMGVLNICISPDADVKELQSALTLLGKDDESKAKLLVSTAKTKLEKSKAEVRERLAAVPKPKNFFESIDPNRFKRVLLTVDGQNFYYAQRHLEVMFDAILMMKEAAEWFPNIDRRWYTANVKGQQDKFLYALDRIGVNVIEEQFESAEDPLFKKLRQGNLDTHLMLDVGKQLGSNNPPDCIILFSSDGDYRHLIKHCKESGIYLVIVSSTQFRVNPVLKESMNHFINLDEVHPAYIRTKKVGDEVVVVSNANHGYPPTHTYPVYRGTDSPPPSPVLRSSVSPPRPVLR